MNYSKRFVVEAGARVKLHKIDPGYIDPEVTEKDALAQTKKLCKRLRMSGCGVRSLIQVPKLARAQI
jgi:hypothetical protein